MFFIVLLIIVNISSLSWTHFLEPFQHSELSEVEIFQYDNYYEYVISNQPLKWDQASAICQHEFNGWLATLETDALKTFVAEAMSESSLDLDGLWIGLKQVEGVFTWLDISVTVLDEEFLKCGNDSIAVAENMNCGGIIRSNHSVPCLVRLPCEADRGFICKRPANKDELSTHPDWIRLGYRLYKIYFEQLSYEEAEIACINKDKKARLAVIETYEDVQTLGRYLLIGRPSLERVWIGARWEEAISQYEFEAESIQLSNATDRKYKYPPWRRRTMTKPFGCILLDRHLANITYFVESNCSRFYCYMCYKTIEESTSDIVCDAGSDYDWKIFYNPLNWFQASKFCENSANNGRLPIVERKDLKSFVNMMERSKRYLFHVWLGAYYYSDAWVWSYTNHTLPSDENDGYPPWVKNKTFVEEVERFNLCLNIDRENPLKPLFYGTVCHFPQTFVCQYDKGTFCLAKARLSTRPTTSETYPTTSETYPTTSETYPTTTTTRITTRTATTTKPTTTNTRITTTTRPTTTTKTTRDLVFETTTTPWRRFRHSNTTRGNTTRLYQNNTSGERASLYKNYSITSKISTIRPVIIIPTTIDATRPTTIPTTSTTTIVHP